jgi:ketosteroid isomerase-like protein
MTQDPAPDPSIVAAIRSWIDAWGAEVASVDLEAGRRRFADEVVAFGTKADVVHGLDHLFAHQWSQVWPKIADFVFLTGDDHGFTVQLADDASIAVAIVGWGSTGFNEDGTAFDRPGRATVVLRRVGDDPADPQAWRAIHTHFSLAVGIPPYTHGRG